MLAWFALTLDMPIRFAPVSGTRSLSDQVAHQLAAEVASGRFAPAAKLPTQAVLAEQFQVSRTVVREAVSRLQSQGLVEARQGSGVYVCATVPLASLRFDARHAASREAVIQMVELRRALESEVAALAAQRRKAADLKLIKQAVAALDRAVKDGGDGVAQDVQLHRCIAAAAGNPFLISTLDYLSQYLHGATQVTRANEARRADFSAQVQAEHQAIVVAIEASDANRARRAAARHMDNAIARIESADPAFWRCEGERLARPLVKPARTTPKPKL